MHIRTHTRTVRLAEEDCEIRADRFGKCYSPDDYSRKPFVGNGKWKDNPYMYWDSSDLEDQVWSGRHGSYPGGGYIQDFLIDESENNTLWLNDSVLTRNAIIQDLIDGNWIDAGTSAVFIDFTLFNPSTLLHTVVRIAFEMPTGGVLPTSEFKSWVFYRYSVSNGFGLWYIASEKERV